MDYLLNVPIPSDIHLNRTLKAEASKTGIICDDHIELRKIMHSKLSECPKVKLHRLNSCKVVP